MTHEFFQNINQQPQQVDPPYLQHNHIIMEIANNWPFVCWMMDKHRHNELKKIDQMEQLWYNVITGNKINVELYKNNEEFLNAWIKEAPNEK